MTRTKKIMKRIADLEAQAREQMCIDYPIGRHVSWSHGAHDRMGEIIRHAGALRVLVRSIGKREQWIYVSRLHQ